nr:glycosyltransferase family 39 protein [Hoyosella altamirensis]
MFIALCAAAGGYGYHRDELYFIAAGSRPAVGYADQPPLVPLLAYMLDSLSGGSLVALRIPSAVAASAVVVVTALIAREFGAGRWGQVLAAAAMAASAVLIAVGHLLSTSTFDLLVWALLCWLVIRAVKVQGSRWLAVGAVAGIGLLTKSLVVFFLAALVAAIVIVGPRTVLRDPWMWGGVTLTVLIALPNIWWQAANGWPQFELSESIAAGGSGTSESRWLFLPFQLVLIGPLLAPIWLAGIWRLLHDPRMRSWRFFAIAYFLLAVIFLVAGGKPYYLAGMYPVLLAAGAEPVIRWLHSAVRRGLAVLAVVTTAVTSALLFLPIVPAAELHKTPIPAINYDAGETIGWREFTATIDAAHRGTEDTGTIVLAGNYGEAGAIEKFLPHIPVFSGHNSYWSWGPPPERDAPFLAVGYPEDMLRGLCNNLQHAATIDNQVNLDNDEQGRPVWLCTDRSAQWDAVWPSLRRIG